MYQDISNYFGITAMTFVKTHMYAESTGIQEYLIDSFSQLPLRQPQEYQIHSPRNGQTLLIGNNLYLS